MENEFENGLEDLDLDITDPFIAYPTALELHPTLVTGVPTPAPTPAP